MEVYAQQAVVQMVQTRFAVCIWLKIGAPCLADTERLFPPLEVHGGRKKLKATDVRADETLYFYSGTAF